MEGRPISDAGLLALAPMRIEARAVAAGAPEAIVARVGLGPNRSARAAARLTTSPPPAAAVAVTGVCGALDGALVAGQLVVASEIRTGTATVCLPSAPLLAGALRRAGLSVALGPVVSTRRLVRGRRRGELAAAGAIAVDMESAAFVAADWGRPMAVVRAVVDGPGRELLSPSTVTGGCRALRALRRAGPVLQAWAAAARPRQVLLGSPRSFCAGVERAIETVERAIERFGPPIYVRKQIIHNLHVVAALEGRGAVFVDDLDDVPPGATVVFSAHGVAPAVRAEAARRGFTVIDATCPLVAKVHGEVRRFAGQGYDMVLIGHPGHDETVGTLGEAAGIHVVERAEDVDRIELADPTRVAYTTQTTLAVDETAEIVATLRARFPGIVGPRADDICYATQNRQDGVRAMAGDCDLILVAGSANSSNANRLVEVARRAGCRAELVDDERQLDLGWLADASTIGITAGASAPDFVVDRLVESLASLGALTIEQRSVTTESVTFTLPMEVR